MIPPLLFLNIDGVFQSRRYLQAAGIGHKDPSHRLDPAVCRLVQEICEDTGAVLVLLAMKNTREDCARFFADKGLTAPLVGSTPDLQCYCNDFEQPWSDMGCGLEIQWWLRTYLAVEQILEARICILDPDSDLGDLRGSLVQTRSHLGLTQVEVPFIYRKLSQSLMWSNAAGGRGRVFFEHDALAYPPREDHFSGPSDWSQYAQPKA